MKETIQKFRKYLDYIEEHYNNVQKAWKLLQEKCKSMNFIYDDHLFFTLDAEIKKQSKGGVTININIELALPENASQETFDTFFKSMKKHLLG